MRAPVHASHGRLFYFNAIISVKIGLNLHKPEWEGKAELTGETRVKVKCPPPPPSRPSGRGLTSGPTTVPGVALGVRQEVGGCSVFRYSLTRPVIKHGARTGGLPRLAVSAESGS